MLPTALPPLPATHFHTPHMLPSHLSLTILLLSLCCAMVLPCRAVVQVVCCCVSVSWAVALRCLLVWLLTRWTAGGCVCVAAMGIRVPV